MNKYKKGFTPLEAALLAVGLKEQQNIPQLKYRQQLPPDREKGIDFSTIDKEDEEYNKTVLEAQEILNALNDETILAYQALKGELNKTVLVIYSEWYTDETQEDIVLERTKLTKKSLAKWFDEVGEKNISKRFKDPEKIIPINNFKQAYTAEHAALIAVKLKHYSSIESAIQHREHKADELFHATRVIEQGGEYTDLFLDPRLEDDSIFNAMNLKEALIDEIKLASETEGYNSSLVDYYEMGMLPPSPPFSTEIVIYNEEKNKEKPIDHSKTLITKESVSIWLFNNGQTEYAQNILPNIEILLQEKRLDESQRQKQWNQTASTNTKEQSTKKTRTHENSLIDSIGIMAWLLSKKINTFKRGDKPNASEIKKYVENVINELELNNDEENKIQISNLNKDIATALKQLEGRFKL
ncbi:hypothetical protein [Colwellia sp. BRX9-1]|uniref:hypothetical protein n=1 Tax=Colwellia sp. BRX9-1 TaxID=2759830 RepID=UPI0015F72EE5|nr:hypothetical protein [Colwellia sp. BRX9-1]MBA6350717.1 hypothetical protein [Colwellia sp. BRX9-1]